MEDFGLCPKVSTGKFWKIEYEKLFDPCVKKNMAYPLLAAPDTSPARVEQHHCEVSTQDRHEGKKDEGRQARQRLHLVFLPLPLLTAKSGWSRSHARNHSGRVTFPGKGAPACFAARTNLIDRWQHDAISSALHRRNGFSLTSRTIPFPDDFMSVRLRVYFRRPVKSEI